MEREAKRQALLAEPRRISSRQEAKEEEEREKAAQVRTPITPSRQTPRLPPALYTRHRWAQTSGCSPQLAQLALASPELQPSLLAA